MARRKPSLRSSIVAEARSWAGTPFVPQASVKGRGCDCKGLIVGVAREVGLPEAESLHAQMANYDLGRLSWSPLLKDGIAATLKPVAPGREKPGDVLLCRFKGAPAHLAILTELPSGPLRAGRLDGGMAVHAQLSSKDWVKETALRVLFAFYPLDSVWRFKKCR